MNEPLTEKQVERRYFEALQYHSFLKTQNEYELEKLLHYTSERINDAWNKEVKEYNSEGYTTKPEFERVMKKLEFDPAYQSIKSIRKLVQQRLNILKNQNTEPEGDITREDFICQYFSYYDEERGLGSTREKSIELLISWLRSRGINPNDTKDLFGITIDLGKYENSHKALMHNRHIWEERKNQEK